MLILDEITASLDAETTSEVLGVLTVTRAPSQTVVMASHHLGFASRFADRIFFFVDGELVETIDGAGLFTRARTARLQKFVSTYL